MYIYIVLTTTGSALHDTSEISVQTPTPVFLSEITFSHEMTWLLVGSSRRLDPRITPRLTRGYMLKLAVGRHLKLLSVCASTRRHQQQMFRTSG